LVYAARESSCTLLFIMFDPNSGICDLVMQILGTHVIKGVIMAADVTDGLEVGTESGETVVFNTDGTSVYVKVKDAPAEASATVVQTDIMSCAGPIHVITTALIPTGALGNATVPAPAPAPMEDMPMPAPEDMPVPAPAPEDMPMPAPAPVTEDMPAPAPALTRALPIIGAEAPGLAPALAPAAVCMSLVDAITNESPELAQIVSTPGVCSRPFCSHTESWGSHVLAGDTCRLD
jgi:hypothetical protein